MIEGGGGGNLMGHKVTEAAMYALQRAAYDKYKRDNLIVV